MHGSSFSAAVCLFALVRSGYAAILHENIQQAPTGWKTVQQPSKDQMITLQIGLTLQNMNQMADRLMSVSTPGSACYANHMDRDDVNRMVQPKPESDQAVQAWLRSEGVEHIQSDGTWITFAAPILTANRLLSTTFRRYEQNGMSKIRTTQYSLPEDVSEHIDIIHPTTFFGQTVAQKPVITKESELKWSLNYPHAKLELPAEVKEVAIERRQSNVDAVCHRKITPACLKQFYNIGNYTPNALSGSKVAFGSFLNQSASYQDLRLYEDANNITPQLFTKIFVNDAADDQSEFSTDNGEANLDVQNIVGVSHPLPVYEILTGGSPPWIPDIDQPTQADNQNEPYIPYLQYLLSQNNIDLPQVISNSYGEPEQTVPLKYAQRACNMFGMLGLRGITVFESTGDTGVGSYCTSNDAAQRPKFFTGFPSTCPYITAVGGTQGVAPAEVAWQNGTGGFSEYFLPDLYQRDALARYLDEEADASALEAQQKYFNRSGRGTPDVSAHSLPPYYEIWSNGAPGPSGGVSAAAPVWAAIVGLLNDARLRAGKPVLGYLNPWLYSDGYKSLIDVEDGRSGGCYGENAQNGKPYNASTIIVSNSDIRSVDGKQLMNRYSPMLDSMQRPVGIRLLGWAFPTFKECWLPLWSWRLDREGQAASGRRSESDM